MGEEVKYVAVFPSWIEAADALKNDAERGKFYTAVMHYAMDDTEPQLVGQVRMIFNLIRPVIDKSKYRRAGRTSGNTTGKQVVDNLLNNLSTFTRIKEKGEGEGKGEGNSLKSAPPCAYAPEIEKIARNYPPTKVRNWRKVIEAIIHAVNREMDERPGATIEDALHIVENGTIAYADAVAKWKDKQYITDAVKFYDTGMYNDDPSAWVRSDEKDDDPWGLREE